MQFYKTQLRHFNNMVVINTSYSTTFNFPRININYPLIEPKKQKQKQKQWYCHGSVKNNVMYTKGWFLCMLSIHAFLYFDWLSSM